MTPLLALLTWVSLGARAEPGVPASLAPPTPVPAQPTYDPRVSLAPLVEAVQAAVVTIEVESEAEAPSPHLMQILGVDPHALPSRTGEGSGFFVTHDGLVLTNHHVIKDADRITLKLADGTSVAAQVLGADATTDVA